MNLSARSVSKERPFAALRAGQYFAGEPAMDGGVRREVSIAPSPVFRAGRRWRGPNAQGPPFFASRPSPAAPSGQLTEDLPRLPAPARLQQPDRPQRAQRRDGRNAPQHLEDRLDAAAHF